MKNIDWDEVVKKEARYLNSYPHIDHKLVVTKT
jgi:hypothetical protein